MNIPEHIAIIMDGNRRWAKLKGLPVLAGHKYVSDKILEPLVEHAAKRGVAYITFWAWSTENWQRGKREVAGIMMLLKKSIIQKLNRLHRKGIRIKVIGDITGFNKDLQNLLNAAIEQTKNNQKITTVFALNYGGRDEIIRTIRKCITYQVSSIKKKNMIYICPESNQRDTLTHDTITFLNTLTPDSFSLFLDTAGIPDPDIIIRTGGEHRLSGFMLWQSEYSELYFTDFLMPEFTPDRLDEILADFSHRQRRFGR